MKEKISRARELFFSSGKTQREIAAIVGVSEKTIYNWVRAHNWQQIREASYHAPALIADNLCRQIIEMQEQIDAREPGNRYPSADEAEVLRKLITCMEKMKKFPTLGMYRQMFANFFQHIDNRNPELKWPIQLMVDSFFEGRNRNGFAPYETEYTAHHSIPISDLPPVPQNPLPEEEGPAPVPTMATGQPAPTPALQPAPAAPANHEKITDKPLTDQPVNKPGTPSQKNEDQLIKPTSNAVPPPVKTGNPNPVPIPSGPPVFKPGKLVRRY